MRDTRAVIFDMDGLLIDTEPVWRRVEIDVFGHLGLHLTEEQCMETMGVRVSEVVKLWYDRSPWEGPSLDDVTRRIVNGVLEYVRAGGVPIPGAVEALRTVHAAGLPIAIASSSSEETIHTVVERLDVGKYITLLCSADNELAGKPDPAVYFTTARKLGVPPHQCVALEDSPNGVLAAKAAGMYCIAVPDRHLAADPRLDAADVRLESLQRFSLRLLPGVCTRTVDRAPVQIDPT